MNWIIWWAARRLNCLMRKEFLRENYSYSAFSLMVTKALVGKSVVVDGHEVILNYAGKIN